MLVDSSVGHHRRFAVFDLCVGVCFRVQIKGHMLCSGWSLTFRRRVRQEHLMHFLQERFQSIAEASFRNWELHRGGFGCKFGPQGFRNFG